MEETGKTHKCSECGKAFNMKGSLTIHMRTHTGQKPFQCPTCSRSFTQSGHLKEHIRTHTGERPYQCATCGKAFQNGSHLRNHMRTHLAQAQGDAPQVLPPLHNCPTCQKGFNHIGSLKSHQETHEGSASAIKKRQQLLKRFTCDLCGAAFRAKHSLKTHLLTHTGHRPHVCTQCSKGFTQSSHVREHMLTHNASTSRICRICGVRCKSVTHARKHAKIHSGVAGGGNVIYKCSVCSENFHKLERLKTHMQRHTGEKIFKCGICSRSFGESSLLVSHMRTHSGERPFECNICTKRFAQRSVLRCHLKMHAGDKRYVCDVCNKRFITQSDVVKHSRVHTKEKPFACQFCNSCFSRSNHLSRHIKIHFRSKKTAQKTDDENCTQSNTVDNLYTEPQTINAPMIHETGTFLKVNNLYGFFENIERSSMKTIHPNESFEANRFVPPEENFMNFQGTLGLEEEHTLNSYVIENQREGETLRYNFEMYDSPRFQYEPNNEVRNQYEKNRGDGRYEMPEQKIQRIIVPTTDAKTKLSCRWTYPNTGAHLKNSCKEISNKTMDNSKPWQCGICDVSFKEQDQLKEHINEHKSVMPSVKYTKLVKNPDTGSLEEKDVIPRNKLKLVSREVIEPILNAHFAKDKMVDPTVLSGEDQNTLNTNNVESNQYEESREYSDWSHEQQHYRDTVIIERQEYFKECQDKQITVNYERSQVIMDMHNYKDNQTVEETDQTYDRHSKYLHETSQSEVHIPNALDPVNNYVYEHENHTVEPNLPCQDILEIQQFKTNGDLTNIEYDNDQREYLQINACHEEHVHNTIEQNINYVYEDEHGIVSQSVTHIHPEENIDSVHIPEDIAQPIEYIYEHKKGFVAQKMSLMHSGNIALNNTMDEPINFNYHPKDIMSDNSEMVHISEDIDNASVPYAYDQNPAVENTGSQDYDHMMADIQQNSTQIHDNEIFDLNMQCQKDDELIDKMKFQSDYKRHEDYVISEEVHKSDEYIPQETHVDTSCLANHLENDAANPDERLSQNEFCFLDHSNDHPGDQDELPMEKSVLNETTKEEYQFNSGPLMEDSYDNIDSLPTINPATQELQESFSNMETFEENPESVIKKCEPVKREKDHTCDECDKIFRYSHSLVVHMRSHSGERPFECTECSSRFIQRANLQEHLLIHSDQRNHQCDQCGKAFIKASHLKNHLKIHSDEKEFMCDLCDKTFKHRLGWQLHQNTHGEDTPYKCELCGKGFRHPSTLVSHQRTHTGNRPYICTTCNASFSQVSTLTSHQRIHTDSRPYICPQCSKGFRSTGDLNRHIQTHSGVRNFVCINPGCSKTFVRKSHLQRHMSTHNVVIDSVT